MGAVSPDRGSVEQGFTGGRAHGRISAAERPGTVDRDLAAALLTEFGMDGLARLADRGVGAVCAEIDRRIAAIDTELSGQVDAILHHPRFQRLESAWRSVAYLVDRIERSDRTKIRLLSVTWAELARDLDRAAEFDQSQVFQKIYSNELDMPGGEPYGLLIGDFYVQHRPQRGGVDDVATLRQLSSVASAAFAPLVVGAAPELLGLDSFRELSPTRDLPGLFKQREYSRWRSLQTEDDTRFLGVALPPVLARHPYAELPRRDGFRYAEDVSAVDGRGYLWGNPAFAFASVAMRSFEETGWFADIRGTHRGELGGGLVIDLPVLEFGTDAPGVAYRAPTQIDISDEQERALSELGLIPLSASQYTPYLIFYANQSLLRPKQYDTKIAQTNARISAMLHYVLCVSRFAHYVKIFGREMVGSFITPEECQRRLQDWIADYTMAPTGGQDDASLLATYPLSEGEVRVREKAGKPGSYHCVMHLRPHYQMDEVVSSLRLSTELAPGAPA